MMKRISVILFLLLSVSSFAKDHKPNFSGMWNMDSAACKLQIPVPDSMVLEIKHHEPIFEVIRSHLRKGESDVTTQTIATDGKEVVEKGVEATSYNRCAWEGSQLVCTSKIIRGMRASTREMKYSLSPDRKSLTAEEHYEGPAVKFDNVWVFLKEE